MSSPQPQDPRPPSQPDPRLGKASHYDRDETVSDLQSFYAFLPHVPSTSVQRAPAGGWPGITCETLSSQGIIKTPEVIALLQHLPYISGPRPWIMTAAQALDYRIILEPERLTRRNKPGWLYDVAADDTDDDGTDRDGFPPWTVRLTAGTDREGHAYILDTSDGTVVRHCVTGIGGQYVATYAGDDVRAWRDRLCDPEIWTFRGLLAEWRTSYRELNVFGIPQPLDDDEGVLGWPDIMERHTSGDEGEVVAGIYREHGWPDAYNKEACIRALREWWRARETG
ncbi:hypothetical protein F5Y19DRAFT_396392 [Xylariaceae sp. FL1651]|nr:hypothetical protein F5Y19DRAFT_396392 [Xylariaceae sp. FL1651]